MIGTGAEQTERRCQCDASAENSQPSERLKQIIDAFCFG